MTRQTRTDRTGQTRQEWAVEAERAGRTELWGVYPSEAQAREQADGLNSIGGWKWQVAPR